MKPIKDDISAFEAMKPPHFLQYRTPRREMQVAWNGDATKRPLLFVHGSPGSWKAWAKFLQDPELTKNFHILAIDRPGFGGSGAGKSEVNLSQQAADVIEALQFNKSGLSAILVGHSFGGPVIAQMAVTHPTKVAALVFVASSVDPDLEEIHWYQHVGTWWPFRWMLPKDLRVCNEEIYALKPHLESLKPQLKNITAPVVIIHGDQDPLVPVGNAAFLQREIPTRSIKETTIIKGMNHFIPWKRPDVIKTAILKLRAE